MVTIIDEADLWVENFHAHFTKGDELAGLYGINRSLRVHLLSATWTDFFQAVFEVVTEQKAIGKVLNFNAKNQIVEADTKLQNGVMVNCPDRESMLTMFYAAVGNLCEKEPIIVFAEEDQEAIFNDLKKKFTSSNVEVLYVKDNDSALRLRLTNNRKRTSIYVLDRTLARGYDLKLQADAVTFVVAFKNEIAYSEYVQMLGRGSRSFGIAKGFYYTYMLSKDVDLREQLTYNEKKFYDAAKILARLMKRWPHINLAKDKKKIAETFQANKHHKKMHEFDRDESEVGRLLP